MVLKKYPCLEISKDRQWGCKESDMTDFHLIDTEPSLQVWNKFHLIAMYDPIYILLNLA